MKMELLSPEVSNHWSGQLWDSVQQLVLKPVPRWSWMAFWKGGMLQAHRWANPAGLSMRRLGPAGSHSTGTGVCLSHRHSRTNSAWEDHRRKWNNQSPPCRRQHRNTSGSPGGSPALGRLWGAGVGSAHCKVLSMSIRGHKHDRHWDSLGCPAHPEQQPGCKKPPL